MSSVESWFPTLIYSGDIESNLEDACYDVRSKNNSIHDWKCDTYSSLNQYSLVDDIRFKSLIESCCFNVGEFAKLFGVTAPNVICKDAWVNIAVPGNNQEYHIHSNSHFSLVYYVKSFENSGNLIFRSHEANTDMFGLPIEQMTDASFKTCSYKATPNKFLIFRSNLQHMVETNKSNEDRISISMNFTV
jgi:uncharacterized protein (TIGR02466 family)